MSELDFDLGAIAFESHGQIIEGQVKTVGSKGGPVSKGGGPVKESYAVGAVGAELLKTKELIRNYALFAISAFKDFGAAEVSEVTLKFGINMKGFTGIPYIVQGEAESNLAIEVKCKFPDQKVVGGK
ncbi:MAG: CU044_2847 family protein [Microcoleaceae cyanobacterium]